MRPTNGGNIILAIASNPASVVTLRREFREVPPQLSRHVNHIATWRCPKINPPRLVSPFLFRHAEIVAAVPCYWNQTGVTPSRLNPRAIPCAAVVQNKHQAASIVSSRTLHDVEIVICEQNLRRAGGVLFVNLHK